MDTLVKGISSDIHNAVRRATAHLKETKAEDPLKGVGDMLQVAHIEQQNPEIKPKADKEARIKQSLLDLLTSKASIDDFTKLSKEKTNKTDTDLQMRCIDILHKQIT